MTRELITHPLHDREVGLGFLAIAWISHFCVHGPGDVAERPLDPELPGALPLGDEMLAFVVDIYAAHPETGRRLYNDAFVSRPKGWAKSELAALVVLFEAFGPSRVRRGPDGVPLRARGGETFRAGTFVYTYEAGDFMGEAITDPIIRCLATEEGQAGNTYDNVLTNLGYRCTGSRRLIEAYGVTPNDVGVMKIKLPGQGEIIPSTASAGAKDGGKESFVVFDESHLYITPELHKMYDTVTRNLGKREAAQPWSLETSTMYAPGENSVAEATHKHARAIKASKTRAVSTYFDHRQAPEGVPLGDAAALRAAIEEAYGDAAAYTDVDRKVNDFQDPRKKIEDLKRYTLNQPTAPSDAWLTGDKWGAVGPGDDEALQLEPGDKITLGFDGSLKRERGLADATALIACRVSDGLLVPLMVDQQPDGPTGEDWEVDVQGFLDAVDTAFETYDVVAFYADPPFWLEVVAGWDAKYGEQLTTKASTKSATGWWTNAETRMGRALDAFHGAVVDRDLRHNGDATLTQHVLNARRKPRGQNMRIMKDHGSSRNKIDAAVAAVIAFQARGDYIAAGVTKKKRRVTRVVVRR